MKLILIDKEDSSEVDRKNALILTKFNIGCQILMIQTLKRKRSEFEIVFIFLQTKTIVILKLSLDNEVKQ